jgi:hypothetical protein
MSSHTLQHHGQAAANTEVKDVPAQYQLKTTTLSSTCWKKGLRAQSLDMAQLVTIRYQDQPPIPLDTVVSAMTTPDSTGTTAA